LGGVEGELRTVQRLAEVGSTVAELLDPVGDLLHLALLVANLVRPGWRRQRCHREENRGDCTGSGSSSHGGRT
jgi:hypothetical protein